jgi:outer membrane protein, heavy metal efflux system
MFLPPSEFRSLSCLAAVLLLLLSTRARAEELLTRQRVAELVKVAPAAQVAKAEVGVARAAVTAAGVASLENPVVSALGGARFNPDGGRVFNGVATLSWPLDWGSKGDARLDAATAQNKAALGLAETEQHRLLLRALLQHALVLGDEQQLAISVERRTLSARLLAAAQSRHAAGSVPELDVALAAMQDNRDASAQATAAGILEGDRAVLFGLLGLQSSPRVAGLLVPAGEPPPLPLALKQLSRRTDIRAAQAEFAAAQAKALREQAGRWPTVSLLGQYERDDQANIALIGLAVPLPVLNANHAEVLTSNAEVVTAKARLAQTQHAAGSQVKELYARYVATRAALGSLTPIASLATRAVNLATRGYELGENDLASVLLVRREAIDSQEALLAMQQAHAAAKIELMVVAGELPE